jgi:hypothetical protein
MKHASSRELFAYWNAQRGARAVPDRRDIEPGAIRAVLSDTFILTADPRAGHPFRLAGTRICALFCRELKGEAFASLWAEDGRTEMRARVSIVADESIGLAANAKAHNADGAMLDLELLLLPLASRGNPHARIIGTLVPSEAPYWLGVSPITSLTLGSFRHLDAELERNAPLFVSGAMAEKFAVAAATAPGRISSPGTFHSLPPVPRPQHGLRVFEGGRIE